MNEMHVVIRNHDGKQEVVDIRDTYEEAIAVCACWNTMRVKHDDHCFVKKFKRSLFSNKLNEQVNSVYNLKVSYKTLEIWSFTHLDYVFGEKDEIKYFDELGRGGCVQLVRTYDYRENPEKIKTKMFEDVCNYIKKQKKAYNFLKERKY